MKTVFEDVIPQQVKTLIEIINNNSHQAYIVGGSVRDIILGQKPSDWDITTSALPNQIKALFEKTIDTGIEHGTVTVIFDGLSVEITTFRTDGEYLDNRKPAWVDYTSNLEEDLKRRDLTINAIAYHPKEGLVDPFLGCNDIKNRIIKAVGDPDKRFNEDALRMLRAIRFSAQLDFEIEQSTFNSICKNANLIQNISVERIRVELTKLILSDSPLKFLLLRDSLLLEYVLPEFSICLNTPQNHPYHIYNVGLHSLHVVSNIDKKMYLRWAALLHDIGKPTKKTTDEKGIDHFYKHALASIDISNIVLKRLKFDNNSIKIILRLIEHHDLRIQSNSTAVRRAINKVGQGIFLDLLSLQIADTKSQNPEFKEHGLNEIEKIRQLYFEILERNECLSLKDLVITGSDIIEITNAKGKEIGEILNHLLNEVIQNPSLNEKITLIEIAKKYRA